MNIVAFILKVLELKRKAFEEATHDPVGAQLKVLLEYLGRNKETEYGRKYNFSSIRSFRDYQKLVPLIDYEAIRPYVMRMTKGEKNILTKDDPVFYGTTSGTTDQPKFIPTTKYSEAKKAELLEIWSSYIASAHPTILEGKILAIISPEVEGYTESGIRHGAETGHGYRSLPGPIKKMYVLPPEVFDIADYNARYYTILRISMEGDVTDIATLNPNTIILLCQKIPLWQDSIIKDIRDGTISDEFEIAQQTRKALQRSVKPNPKRAAELEGILKEKGRLLPKDFWPKMELIECWKGGMMKLYLKELDNYFGQIPKHDMGCLSTEARCSIPTGDEGASGVLAINTNFYEFIPKEDISKEDKRSLLCNELEVGKEYYILVTTAGGLYRYNIDDIVKVTGFFNKTPTIEFVQKGLSATSITGEKVYESQINDAVEASLKRLGIIIAFFCAIAEIEESRYAFLIEFGQEEPSRKEKAALLKSVDEELCKRNMEYIWIRKAELLKSPVLKVVKRGDFEKFRRMRISQGAHEGQFKIAELTSDRQFEKNFTITETIEMRDHKE